MARVNHRLNFPLPPNECWDIFIKLLNKIAADLGVQVHAFVLMSNHYHLLISTPLKNIDVAMKYLNREATRAMSTKTGLINHIFGARYRWSIAYTDSDVAHVLKYIYRNPVRAKLVERVEDYPYSTVRSISRGQVFDCLRPLPGLANADSQAILKWLNKPLTKEQDELVRRAVRRKEFKFTARRQCRKVISALPGPPGGQKVSTHLFAHEGPIIYISN